MRQGISMLVGDPETAPSMISSVCKLPLISRCGIRHRKCQNLTPTVERFLGKCTEVIE